MKKFLSVILCAAAVLLTGCDDVEERRISYYHSVRISEQETSRKEAEASREAEIQEVDEWGVSLDDVERLAKEAIRKHENVGDYKQDYNKAIQATDKFLDSVESGKAVEYSLEYFINKYDEACSAGVKYIKACVDVKLWYDTFTANGELSKSQKNTIRSFLTMFNPIYEKVEQSKLDMKTLLNPIIEENRKLTDDELKRVFEIYQILTDNVDIASKSY